MILRPYQQRTIREARALYAAGKRAPVVVLPTGGGKTPIAAEMIKLARARGHRCLFLARRVELIDQCQRTLAASGVEARVIQGDRDTAESPVVVASVPTLATPGWADRLPPADLVIWDECHGIKARTSLELAGRYPLAFHLGLTATPARGDNSPLGDVFDSLVIGATVRELTDLGHLVPCRVYAPSQILDSGSLALDPLDAYRKHCAGQRTIVFCGTVDHAATTAAAFRAGGIRAEHVSGSMGNRSSVIARYARGDLEVLVNVALLIEGWDEPSTQSAIFARRFTFPGSYLQAIGRILRPHPGKTTASVVDLCGSALVHGTPDLDREYSLDGKAIRTSDREAIRQCPACGGVFATRDACPYCDTAMPAAPRRTPRSVGAGVGEVTSQTPRRPWHVALEAKRPGVCVKCNAMFPKGTLIVWAKQVGARHVGCPA